VGSWGVPATGRTHNNRRGGPPLAEILRCATDFAMDPLRVRGLSASAYRACADEGMCITLRSCSGSANATFATRSGSHAYHNGWLVQPSTAEVHSPLTSSRGLRYAQPLRCGLRSAQHATRQCDACSPMPPRLLCYFLCAHSSS
jgi:hypothetical protein